MDLKSRWGHNSVVRDGALFLYLCQASRSRYVRRPQIWSQAFEEAMPVSLTVGQKNKTSLPRPVEDIVGSDVRDQLVVNTYPRCPRSIGQVTIGVQNVQRIMASVGGLSMMIQHWINSQHQIDVTQSE